MKFLSNLKYIATIIYFLLPIVMYIIMPTTWWLLLYIILLPASYATFMVIEEYIEYEEENRNRK